CESWPRSRSHKGYPCPHEFFCRRHVPTQGNVILNDVDEIDEHRSLDVTSKSSISGVADKVRSRFGDQPLRVLFNNAGILHPEKSRSERDGPLVYGKILCAALGGLHLRQQPRWVVFVPRFKLFLDARSRLLYDYVESIPRAVQNQIARTIAHELKNRKLNA
ncbi:hypothetical protein BC936DRAFT_140360, partial [Jimgerdemannia flammicorona]